MKKIIKKILPKSLKIKIIKLLKNKYLKSEFIKDYKKYREYSYSFSTEKEKRHYESDLIFYYHKIEKGLSLPEPRIGFGQENIKYMVKLLEEYVNKYGWDDISSISLNTLYQYYYFNKDNNLELNDLFSKIEVLKASMPNNIDLGVGGTIEVSKDEIDNSMIDFKRFAFSRYSIRNFAPGEVSQELINEAVEIAQKTPSVCNRQTSKVYVYSGEEKEKVLKYQNGNAGFGHLSDKILIVTSDLKDFRGSHERNQAYIDGGMYSMSIIYALHSLGLGTCALNLSITNAREEELKKVAKIPGSEVLIMMIAVGHIPDKLKVAWSPRRDVKEVLKVIN